MTFATNPDLLKYMPTVMEHGITDWTQELADAENDIKLIVKTKWFFVEFGSLRTRGMVQQPIYDPTLLVATQWNKATCYLALAAYILPKLSTFRAEGDAFQQQMDFYKQRFNEEMDLQLSAGVQYDINNDNTISDQENFPTLMNRMYR